MVQTVIGEAAPHLVEVIVPPAQSREEIAEPQDINIAGRGQAVHPRVEEFGLVHVQGLVRTECGIHTGRQRGGRELLVILEIVSRIVGRAERLHLEFPQDPVRSQVVGGEQRVCLFPDRGRAALVEQLVDAEVALQFEVRPVVQRIAQRVRHRASPRHEFLERRGIAGTVALGHAVGPHGAPLVMVAFEPDLEQVVEAPVLGDVLRRKMAMIVDDRLRLGVLVIQPLGSFRVQQKIFVDEYRR